MRVGCAGPIAQTGRGPLCPAKAHAGGFGVGETVELENQLSMPVQVLPYLRGILSLHLRWEFATHLESCYTLYRRGEGLVRGET
jgi:hypothetical protein